MEDTRNNPFANPFVISRDRDATVVIRGYVYQVNVTLLKWIELQPGQSLELEAGEDIDVLQDALSHPNQPERVLEAVKHREKNLTLRTPEALSAIATFHEHRHTNPSARLSFRYITNSSIGAENPSITELGTPGIHLWERVRSGLLTGKTKTTVLSALRNFLKTSSRPADLATDTWELLQRFLRRCTLPELNRLIDGLEWSTENPSADDLEGKVRYALINSGALATADGAGVVYQHLFHFVFNLLSQRTAKVLTRDVLLRELKKLDQIDSGRVILENLREMETTFERRFDRIESQVTQLLQSEMPDVRETLGRIESAVIAAQPTSPKAVETGEQPRSNLPIASQMVVSGDVANIVSSALLTQNEGLAAAVVANTSGHITAIRNAARKGLRADALRDIAAQRDNRVTWQVLPKEKKAELLRLEASILLNSGDINKAKELLSEAAALAPAEDDSRLRACIALSENNPQTAISLLEGKEQPESRNLRALLLLITGRAEEGWQTLPALDPDTTVKAETLRIRALYFLHKGDVAAARREIDMALAAQPDWTWLQFISASISYYEGLSPSAIPTRLQDWPEPSSIIFRLNTPEAKNRLSEASAIFGKLADQPENTVEERRLFELWHFATLACDSHRRSDARQYAIKVLVSDPGQYRLIPWILSQRYKNLDLSATEKALATRSEGKQPNVFEVIALIMLQIETSSPADAIATLDRTQQLFLPLNKTAWHHWRAIALLKTNDASAARTELEQFDTAGTDSIWPEIQRLESRQSGNWHAYEEALRIRYVGTNTTDALLEYCSFAASRKKWDTVVGLADELVQRIGTAEAVYLAGIALFNNGRPGDCLAILDSHVPLYRDEFHGEDLRRVSIACHTRLGHLMVARRQAEDLVAMASTTENLLLLAQLQFDTGDSKAFALNVRHIAQRSDLNSVDALRTATLVRHEDAQLAQSLWRKAISSDTLPDEAVGAAMGLGYHLGLDRELRPLLVRMNDLAERGKGGIKRKTLPELIEFVKDHQKNIEWFNDLYNKGEVAVHLIPEGIRGPLVDLYHDSPRRREEQPELPGPSLLAIHGGRPWINGFPDSRPTWRINMDITSILLAHHFDLLPMVERAFGTLRIPPSIFAALGRMQDSLSSAQLTQLDAIRELLACIDIGSVSMVDETVRADEDLVAYGGEDWAVLYAASRRSAGRVIDFIPKLTVNSQAVIPPDAEAQLVNCRKLIETLRQVGAISDDEYLAALPELGTEGQQPSVGSDIDRDTNLYCEKTTAILLASAHLLRAVCRTFRLHLVSGDINEVKSAVRLNERAKELADWLGALIHHLRLGVEQGRYEFMAIAPAPNEADEIRNNSFETKCLSELLTLVSGSNDVVWSDDRYINAYARCDVVPIVSIVDILKCLVASRELTETGYYRLLNRLRAAKCAYIPFETKEILHHLLQAPVSDDALSETPELGISRRYWAENLLRADRLQQPNTSSANASGEVAFLQISANGVREAIAGLWETRFSQTEEEREARAGWLLGAMYSDNLALRAVTKWPSDETQDHELVGVSLGGLVAAGLQMRLENRCTSQGLREYKRWLHHRLLHGAFQRDDRVMQSAASHIKTLLRSVWRTLEGAEKSAGGLVMRVLFEFLPDDLQQLFQADTEFASELGFSAVSLIQVGPFRIARNNYLAAARDAINSRPAKARLWNSTDEMEFEMTTDGVVLTPQNGEKFRIADSLLMLLSDNADQWKKTLTAQRGWFDCATDDYASAIDAIVAEGDPVTRWEEAHRWRERNAALFYSDLPQKLTGGEGFMPDDLRPPDSDGLLAHYRLTRDTEGPSFADQVLAGSEEIAMDFGVGQSFLRYSGLPMPLSSPFFRSVDALSEADKRKLVRQLLRTAPSPISTIHFVRLLTHLANSPASKYWRLASRTVRALLSPEADAQFKAFAILLRWTNNAFGLWQQTRDWSATERLAMVWGHSHRLFSTFVYLGVPTDWVTERFGTADFGLCYELWDQSADYMADISHPKRSVYGHFLLTGLAYATPATTSDWWPPDIRQAFLNLVRPIKNGESRINVELLRNRSLAGNLLGGFLADDYSAFLERIVPRSDIEYLFPENIANLGKAVLEAAQNRHAPENWGAVYHVFGDLPAGPDERNLMESAIVQLDLEARADDLIFCENVLHAAAIQALHLKSSALTTHLVEQACKLIAIIRQRSQDGQKLSKDQRHFLASLYQVPIELARGVEGSVYQASEYARIFEAIANVFPRSAGITRHFVNKIWPCNANQARALWPCLIRSRAVNL